MIPAPNDESNKSDGWRTVGNQRGKKHRQTESSGYDGVESMPGPVGGMQSPRRLDLLTRYD